MIIKLGKPFKPYLTLPSCLTRPHQYNICYTLIEIFSKIKCIRIDCNGDGDIKILNNFRTMFGQWYTHTNLTAYKTYYLM